MNHGAHGEHGENQRNSCFLHLAVYAVLAVVN
jgi:hypothetical protein